MGRNEYFLNKARQLEPKLLEEEVFPEVISSEEISSEEISSEKISSEKILSGDIFKGDKKVILRSGEAVTLDFGNHYVGYLTLMFSTIGSHFDAPAWIRIQFAERLCELEENAEEYHGWISKGWIQQEQLHLDVFPCKVEMPRRYACRYVRIEVLDISSKFSLVLDKATLKAVTSADDGTLEPLKTEDLQLKKLDAIACRTLRNCMQRVFEDGPKRDRRLWMGDLRMQALANYETYHNNDLVKRCLYLFAGTTMDEDKVGACLFLDPEIEVDDTDMFDYALFYIPTLLSYLEATGDMETAKELYPTAIHQLEIARKQMDESGMVMDSDRLGWCFVDWNLFLNKQASAMGIYLYCLDAAERLARRLETRDSFTEELDNLRFKAKEYFWNQEKQVFVSGKDRQISWASQVWMVLGGVVQGDEASELLDRIETLPDAMNMVTPYMVHNYVDALLKAGRQEKALSVLRSYWGGMAELGADTFWELFDPADPDASPYGGTIVNSYCHAWSCAPAYFLRKYFCI